MKKFIIFLLLLAGCGYTLKNIKETPYKTVFIPTFVNKISIQEDSSSYRMYYRGLEIELEDVINTRFRYDGNVLPVSRAEDADIIIKGVILDYDKDALRYASDEDVDEYRIRIRTEVELLKEDEQIWKEQISGESTYLTTGSNAKSETEAVRDVLQDLSRSIIDRVLGDW
ncbi:MAG: LPS assembly lipoprotein LptE [Candidatus Saelkia tenebricola]|nr:LPS assembly lipoprotein LptE [Candidatus Saelkia tenebricola]